MRSFTTFKSTEIRLCDRSNLVEWSISLNELPYYEYLRNKTYQNPWIPSFVLAVRKFLHKNELLQIHFMVFKLLGGRTQKEFRTSAGQSIRSEFLGKRASAFENIH